MNDTSRQHNTPPTKTHVLPALPAELWLNIFDHVGTYDTHVFYHSLCYVRKSTRHLQKLQHVCRSWRDMIEPAVYRHVVLGRNSSHPGLKGSPGAARDHITALASLLHNTTDSGTTKASWVRSFCIQKDICEKGTTKFSKSMQTSLPGLMLRMENLRELCCRIALDRPNMASIAYSHGPQLTKLGIGFGDPIHTSECLPLLKHFTALRDLRLNVPYPFRNDIEPLDLPKLRLLEVVTESATDGLLAWLTQWNMPLLSAFSCLKPYYCGRTIRPDLDLLTAFMAKHGAGLKIVTFDNTNPALAVFPYTPSLEIYKQFDITDVIEGLPVSVTQIFICQFGENLGYQVRILRHLFQTVESLPPERNLHTIRVVSKGKHLGGAPFSWWDRKQWVDRRRLNTWKDFNKLARGLLKLGVSILDEQNLALTDVLEEMEPSQESMCTELLESATDALLGSEE